MRRGGTLVEAIAAIVISSVAIPPLLWAMQGAHATRVDAVLVTRARWLASEKIEDILADRHSTARGYNYVVAGNYPDESSVAGFASFARTVSIVETDHTLANAGSGYKLITVTVEWSDGNAQPRALSLGTVLTSYSP